MSAARSLPEMRSVAQRVRVASIRELVRGADERLELARRGHGAASASLLRDASGLLLRALATERGRAERLPLDALLSLSERPSRGLSALLRDHDMIGADQATCDELETLVVRLRQRIDPRTKKERLVSRVQVAAVILVAIVALAMTVGRVLLEGPNVAVGKRVTTSTVPNGDPAFAALVDGEIHDPFAAATLPDRPSWVQVDLGARYALTRVRVFARRDCCWAADLPYVLEISDDARTWSIVGTKTGLFHPNDPWSVALRRRTARYVRVRSVVAGTIVALASIEVHGRPALRQ